MEPPVGAERRAHRQILQRSHGAGIRERDLGPRALAPLANRLAIIDTEPTTPILDDGAAAFQQRIRVIEGHSRDAF